MKTLLKFTHELAWFLGTAMVIMLAILVWEHGPAYQRVSTLLAQEAGPLPQNADDSLGGLLNEETAPKTTADENAPPRSIIAQLFDFMSDAEFVTYLGLTGETAEQLDKEEADFVKTVQSNPQLYEAHLHEAVAKHAGITRQSLANKFGENWASLVDTNHFAVQMRIFHVAEQEALRRTKKGELTDKQQEEANMKKLLASERERYQWLTDSVALYQDTLKTEKEWEKQDPFDEDNKYERMKSELRLAQRRAAFELHRPLWVHLGFLPEDNVHKQDKTLQYYDLLSMSIRIGDAAQKKDQELWDAADPKLRAWITAENAKQDAFDDREFTLTTEAERESWWTLWVRDFDLAASIAMDDTKFASWRASVNEAASPPVQNPGGLLLEELNPIPAPVTNTDDGGETTPTPAPSPGSEEETTSGGSLGDDATPGSDGPTVPGGLE